MHTGSTYVPFFLFHFLPSFLFIYSFIHGCVLSTHHSTVVHKFTKTCTQVLQIFQNKNKCLHGVHILGAANHSGLGGYGKEFGFLAEHNRKLLKDFGSKKDMT